MADHGLQERSLPRVPLSNYSPDRLFEIIDFQGRRSDWFAEALGMAIRGEPFDRSYITKLRTGERTITDEIACKAAAILGVPVDWFRVASPIDTDL